MNITIWVELVPSYRRGAIVGARAGRILKTKPAPAERRNFVQIELDLIADYFEPVGWPVAVS